MDQHPRAAQISAAVVARLETGGNVQDVEGVLAVMRDLDGLLPDEDGLKWFNLLYRMVTESIHAQLPTGEWADTRWLTQLDVLFARRYFDALLAWHRDPGSAPRAWRALFAARYRPGIRRVQFALAGMNAHINHDLPLAVVETCVATMIEPERGSLQFQDFERVNQILEEVEPRALQHLATGILGLVAEELGVLRHVLSMWSVRHARDTAWTNGSVLWDIRDAPRLRNRVVLALDRMTGFAGRGLLLPVV